MGDYKEWLYSLLNHCDVVLGIAPRESECSHEENELFAEIKNLSELLKQFLGEG